MASEVLIKITTRIIRDNQNIENFNYDTNGNYYIKDDDLFLRYKENEELGLSNTWSIIKWSNKKPDKISIIRQGEIKAKQVFSVGLNYRGVYQTPYGKFVMDITTIELSFEQTNLGGKLFLHYKLTMNEQFIGDYQLEIIFITKEGAEND